MKIFHCAANSGLLSCLPMVYPACCPCSSSLSAENCGGGLLPLGSNSTIDGYIPTAVSAAVVQSVRPISNPTTEPLQPRRMLPDRTRKPLQPHRKLTDQTKKPFQPRRKLIDQMKKPLQPRRMLPDRTRKLFQPRRKLPDRTRKPLHLRRFDRYPLFVCRKTGKSLPQPAAPHNFGFGIPKPSMPLYCTCFHRRWQDRTLPFLKTPSRLHLTESTLFLSC